MKANTLVEILERDVIKGNLDLYRNLLDTTNEVTDPVWEAILPLYINFSKDEKEAFLNFLKVVEINSVSHVLGLLDGTIYADGIEEDFILTTEGNVGFPFLVRFKIRQFFILYQNFIFC